MPDRYDTQYYTMVGTIDELKLKLTKAEQRIKMLEEELTSCEEELAIYDAKEDY